MGTKKGFDTNLLLERENLGSTPAKDKSFFDSNIDFIHIQLNFWLAQIWCKKMTVSSTGKEEDDKLPMTERVL